MPTFDGHKKKSRGPPTGLFNTKTLTMIQSENQLKNKKRRLNDLHFNSNLD